GDDRAGAGAKGLNNIKRRLIRRPGSGQDLPNETSRCQPAMGSTHRPNKEARMKPVARVAAIAASALMLSAAVAQAEPAIVYDTGGKYDKSFNEAAFNGMEKFKKETGTKYLEFELQTDAQREQAFERFAEKGADPIIGVGFSQADAISKVAPKFPKLHFVL